MAQQDLDAIFIILARGGSLKGWSGFSHAEEIDVIANLHGEAWARYRAGEWILLLPFKGNAFKTTSSRDI